ncbi:Chondroitin synthase protein [Marine Group I thaumarchaeote SCGC AAA799-P11]|uniref:Chondroitin synthase protein n=1 Tax=Marine Group I thaumarchaeote SCGC AAA799-P11 TaxID=1502295 RepID=A0A087S317_9ARCH|nr:Chondroitin synthase protein [Marine Group I thaumarchaeote SCGC AAA799-P11]
MPVYNGELFIKRAIESILSQTFTDFEFIISDNSSTDSTYQICQNFLKKDERIKLFKQNENIGIHRNFNFLLSQAKGEYFAWTAVDDYLDDDFMEKNLKILESDNSIVSSIGRIIPYGTDSLEIDTKLIETSNFPKFLKGFVKQGRRKKMTDTDPISGNMDHKIRTFLKITKSLGRFYGVHRTKQLKQCIVEKPFINVEVSVFLNLLKLGDFYEESSTTLYEFDEGISSRGIINMAKYSGHSTLGILFPFYPFTNWVIKNFGILTFFKNFDIFFRMNLGGEFALFVDIFLRIFNRFKKDY